MVVTAKVFGELRKLIGAAVVELSVRPCAVVEDVLTELQRRFPILEGKLRLWISTGYVNIFVNGQDVLFLDGLKTEISDGATILFLPPIGGG